MSADPQRIIDILHDSGGWLDARYLADALGVTTRSIRTYVKRINEGSGVAAIESSYRGYRLTREYVLSHERVDSRRRGGSMRPQEERADALLRKLISENGTVSVYDLAEEFFVSDSTIEADLKRVRDSVRLFDLSISRYRDTISLEGSELNKRKLIGQLLTTESPVGFSAFAGSGIVREGYNRAGLSHTVSGSLSRHNLKSDDFGLNNVIIHLVIMVDRMRQGMQMPDDASTFKVEGTPAYFVAREICDAMEELFSLAIPESEVGYLALVVVSNSRSDDYSFTTQNALTSLVDQRDIDITQQAVSALEHAYYLDPFDSPFVTRMAVHVHSLLQRVESNIGAHNPLLDKIKETYPLVYDMAVFFAGAISRAGGIVISEDEIAFLAFHIGAYLEKNGPGSEMITATFLYMNYHDMYRLALDRIRDEFKNSLSIIHVEPINEFDASGVVSDLVLSPVEIATPETTRLIVLSPILKDADLRTIRKAIEAQRARKRGVQAFSLINRFLTPELFHRNLVLGDSIEMIGYLSSECIERGFAGDGFCEEVLEREEMSPTSFGNRVAIPHSMSASANRSFLSVVVNEQSMPWGQHDVNLIMLMGISADDRKAFRLLFDSLIEVMAEPVLVNRLVKCRSYSEFAEQLNEMIMGIQ